MTLAPELIGLIRDNGPLTVAKYMARCNAHYYGTRDPLGAQGDFTTAPEISQIFGELVGAWIVDTWRKQGQRRSAFCEFGPGRGTLMKDALRATRAVEGFHDAISIHITETSPKLRAIQQQNLKDDHLRIAWHEEFEIPALPLLFVANEFFDALPVTQYVGETERRVDYDGKKFYFTPEGAVTRETSPDSETVIRQIATHIKAHGGAALIIDYGYANGEQGDTLQAVKNHAYVDPLAGPGEADLTAHVDFAALARAAKDAGAHVHGPVEQGTFLKRLGAELRATALCKNATPQQRETILSGLERLVAPHQMGRLFKVMAVTSSLEAPAGF